MKGAGKRKCWKETQYICAVVPNMALSTQNVERELPYAGQPEGDVTVLYGQTAVSQLGMKNRGQ